MNQQTAQNTSPSASSPVTLIMDETGIAHIELSRPESANGLNEELLQALYATLMRIHGDADVRVVLLTAQGKNFCAGGDVHAFLGKGEALPAYIRTTTAYLQQVVSLMTRLNAPVVTAVQGFAAGGGGMGLVCASDIVLAASSASFLTGATRVAMVPDAGVSVTLTQLVGFRKAMELLLLNPVLTASDALALGLITRVVPEDELVNQAWALARTLAAGAPAALAATKRLLWTGIGRTLDAAMWEENQCQAQLCGMQDALEGLAAVIDRRAPHFTGR